MFNPSVLEKDFSLYVTPTKEIASIVFTRDVHWLLYYDRCAILSALT